MFKLCRIFNTSGNYMRMPKPLLNELKTLIAQNVLAKDIKRYTENKIKEALIFCYGETKEKTYNCYSAPALNNHPDSFISYPSYSSDRGRGMLCAVSETDSLD